jgi:hypothetical protein
MARGFLEEGAPAGGILLLMGPAQVRKARPKQGAFFLL